MTLNPMKMKTIKSKGHEVHLPIPETAEEARALLGDDWLLDAAMGFHYRVTLPRMWDRWEKKDKAFPGTKPGN